MGCLVEACQARGIQSRFTTFLYSNTDLSSKNHRILLIEPRVHASRAAEDGLGR